MLVHGPVKCRLAPNPPFPLLSAALQVGVLCFTLGHVFSSHPSLSLQSGNICLPHCSFACRYYIVVHSTTQAQGHLPAMQEVETPARRGLLTLKAGDATEKDGEANG